MATRCFVPLLGKRIRVTALDSCGNPPAPAEKESVLVTGGFITVSLSSEVEDGAEIMTKRADGSLCVNERFASSFKRFNLEIEFCEVNPSLLSMVSNAEPYKGAGPTADTLGITVPEGEFSKFFSFELWTGVASGGGCEAGASYQGGYILLPFVGAGTLGDLEIGGEDAITFSVTGAYTKGGNNWGAGPYGVYAATAGGTATALPTPIDPLDHLLLMQTTVEPPAESCDPMDMPAALTP